MAPFDASGFHAFCSSCLSLCLCTDNSLYEGHFRVQPLYDAIVSDPPYGIRAGARRSGSRRETVNDVPSELREEHIPMTRPYPVVSDVP